MIITQTKSSSLQAAAQGLVLPQPNRSPLTGRQACPRRYEQRSARKKQKGKFSHLHPAAV